MREEILQLMPKKSRIMKDYYEQLYVSELKKLEKLINS